MVGVMCMVGMLFCTITGLVLSSGKIPGIDAIEFRQVPFVEGTWVCFC